MGLSPTQRTLQYLRDNNVRAGIVEKWVPIKNHPGGGKRIDLFGIIDIVGLDNVPGTLYIQSCGSAFSEHIKKIQDDDHIDAVKHILTTGNRLWLIGWRKLKLQRGGKAMRWRPRIAKFKLEGDVLTYEELK